MIWFKVDKNSDEILGMARFANPEDRLVFNTATTECQPNNDIGYLGNCPEPLVNLYANPIVPLYRWNGTDPEAL